jgi:DNA-binding MarR family transcriptional regulator
MAVKPPSITALVDGLVSRGLVARTADVVDRRRITHELTTAGRELHSAASSAIAARLSHLVGYVGDEALGADMIAALAGWNDAIERARDAKRLLAEVPAQ